MCWADTMCALTRWEHISAWNDLVAAILKMSRQVENLTPSIDAYMYLQVWKTCMRNFIQIRFEMTEL